MQTSLNTTCPVGLFGKIPAQGDFIERNLQRSFSLPWDDWLQRCLACSREQLDEHWLETYLSSPIWRFCLSAGAIDSMAWAGILMPSVDSVGRYYPLSVVRPIAGNSNLFEFLRKNSPWYESLEAVAIASLQGDMNADTLIQQLLQLHGPEECMPQTALPVVRVANGLVIQVDDAHASSSYSQLLHHTLTPQCSSQSLWWSGHSQIMKPTFFQVQGLPNPEQFSSLLSGHW